MHFRYENARRDRVYGKHIPNTRVDTSELADRVSAIISLECNLNLRVHRTLTGAWVSLRRLTGSCWVTSLSRNYACPLMGSHSSLIPNVYSVK